MERIVVKVMQGEDKKVPDEAVLVRRLKKGDFEAFDAIFEKHRRGVLAYVRTMVKDHAAAEDVVQECFVKLVEKIDTIRPGAGVSGWLYRVARNRSIDVIRKGRFELLTDEPQEHVVTHEVAPKTPLPSDILIEDEQHQAVRAAIDQLPEDLRSVVALRFLSDLKFREIAEALDRPLGTVLWQGQRALAELKVLIGKQATE